MQRYEKTLGTFPRSALDKLKKWQDVYSTELICKAFDEAAENNVRKWRYVDGVLKGWQADGVRTLGDVETRREARKKSKDPAEDDWKKEKVLR
ncbi:MAG TPA: DnaD domain protein [Faecalibacterium prausnitzii]|nr:DnaD domain protein [Faecalibacterium prausnitzii]